MEMDWSFVGVVALIGLFFAVFIGAVAMDSYDLIIVQRPAVRKFCLSNGFEDFHKQYNGSYYCVEQESAREIVVKRNGWFEEPSIYFVEKGGD